MKLYATTTSERASKGQGGNEYIETKFYITEKEKPQARVRIINDEKMGLIYISFEEYFFEKWSIKYQTEYYLNIEQKGKSQKGEECNDITCVNCDNTMEGLCDNCR